MPLIATQFGLIDEARLTRTVTIIDSATDISVAVEFAVRDAIAAPPILAGTVVRRDAWVDLKRWDDTITTGPTSPIPETAVDD